MRLLINIAIVLICALTACTAARVLERQSDIESLPDQELLGADTIEDRDQIFEAVFRYMAQPEPKTMRESHSLNRVHKIYFLKVGRRFDPPTNILVRLNDLPALVQPVSEAYWSGFYSYDSTGRKRGAVFHIWEISTVSKDEAEVDVALSPGGGLSASGYSYRLVRKEGGWTVVDVQRTWVS